MDDLDFHDSSDVADTNDFDLHNPRDSMQSQNSENQTPVPQSGWQRSDDTWAMIMAAGLLVIVWCALQPVLTLPTGETSFENLLAPWVAKPGSWSTDIRAAFDGITATGGPSQGVAVLATAAGCITAVSYTHLTLPTTPYV